MSSAGLSPYHTMQWCRAGTTSLEGLLCVRRGGNVDAVSCRLLWVNGKWPAYVLNLLAAASMLLRFFWRSRPDCLTEVSSAAKVLL